jgi:hypothetical protein
MVLGIALGTATAHIGWEKKWGKRKEEKQDAMRDA